MKDIYDVSPVERYLKCRATKIVDNAITKTNNYTKDDLISLVVELLREFDRSNQ